MYEVKGLFKGIYRDSFRQEYLLLLLLTANRGEDKTMLNYIFDFMSWKLPPLTPMVGNLEGCSDLLGDNCANYDVPSVSRQN